MPSSFPQPDSDFLLTFLVDLLNTPSPTGYAERAIELTESAFGQFSDLELSRPHRPRRRRLAQLRADAHGGAVGDDEMGNGVFVELSFL